MDAVEFVKERNRMCKMYYEAGDDVCSDCPAKYEKCTMIDPMKIMTEGEIAKIVQIVEKWSIEHPRKTRRDIILAQWPNATPEKIAPCYITGKCDYHKRCGDCHKAFWMQEVE